jgi:hypothetical protein
LRILAAAARAREQGGDPDRAVELYRVLLGTEAGDEGEVVLRSVLALDAAGESGAALALTDAARGRLDLATTLALERTGRRIARRTRSPWKPWPPPRAPWKRCVRLPMAGARTHRPLFEDPDGPCVIEDAVSRRLERSGRRVLRGEGAPWTSLFAALLYDLYWLPVPGMLPIPCLSGPLDLGTPDFALHRADALEARLVALRRGEGPSLVQAWASGHAGEALEGLDSRIPREDLTLLADALGGPALAAICAELARRGWKASRGMPDLLVLPGPEVHLAFAIPAWVRPDLVMVEVKGPTDAPSDAQRAWYHLLVEEGVRVEQWEVSP